MDGAPLFHLMMKHIADWPTDQFEKVIRFKMDNLVDDDFDEDHGDAVVRCCTYDVIYFNSTKQKHWLSKF